MQDSEPITYNHVEHLIYSMGCLSLKKCMTELFGGVLKVAQTKPQLARK